MLVAGPDDSEMREAEAHIADQELQWQQVQLGMWICEPCMLVVLTAENRDVDRTCAGGLLRVFLAGSQTL